MAEKGPFSSNSDFLTACVPQDITRKRPGSSSVSLGMSLAALLQTSRPYCRPDNCRSGDLVPASNFDASVPAFNGSVQLFVMDPSYSVRQLRKFKSSAQDEKSAGDMENAVELIADLLGPGRHAILFFTVQQFAVWHTPFCAQVYAGRWLVFGICVDIR